MIYNSKYIKPLVLPLLVAGISACDNTSSNTKLDIDLRAVVEAEGHTADPAQGRTLPSISDPQAQLGMKLFFSQSLGGQTDAACVTCHHPVLGGGDNLPLPIGVDAEFPELMGPGRVHSSAGFHFDGGPTVPRNAPTTFNIALWDQFIFHDGRIESLGKTPGLNGDDGVGIRTPDSAFGTADPNAENLAQAQVLFPVTSAEEMRAEFEAGSANQVVRDALVARLVDPLNSEYISNTWLEEFQTAFNSTDDAATLITYQNISRAIAAYERSQVFVETPWKQYVEGDNKAISNKAKRGALLFFAAPEDGGAGCASCHSGDFFTDEQFHVVAMPQIGRGKGNGTTGDNDFGRFRETGFEGDRFAFRTPSLINVEVTGPYTHAGAYTDLADVVRHHLDPATAVAEYDYSGTDLQPGIQTDNAADNTGEALAQLQALRASGDSLLQDVSLTEAEVGQLVAFLEALTDPCVEDRECLADWIPDTDDTGPDGLQLNGVDENNDLL